MEGKFSSLKLDNLASWISIVNSITLVVKELVDIKTHEFKCLHQVLRIIVCYDVQDDLLARCQEGHVTLSVCL